MMNASHRLFAMVASGIHDPDQGSIRDHRHMTTHARE
jgi:hypothetical protein